MSIATFFKHEIKELLAISVFFFSAFLLIFVLLDLVLEDHNVRFNAFAKAGIGALVLAKVILVLRGFAFMRLFPNAYGIVRVLYKTLIYLAGVAVVLAVEKTIEAYGEAGGILPALRHVAETRKLHHVLAVTLLVGIPVTAFNCWEELLREVGQERLLGAFFRKTLPARDDR